VLLLESTYGDRNHRTYAIENAAEEVEDIIVEASKMAGNILIPSFARVGDRNYLSYFAHSCIQKGQS